LIELGKLVLGVLDHVPRVKLAIVMILVPVAGNAAQYWAQDNILKRGRKKWDERKERRQKIMKAEGGKGESLEESGECN